MSVFGFLFWSALLVVGSKGPAVILLMLRGEKYRNDNPRVQFEQDEQLKRAYNAHLNTIEAFPVFAVGMLVAHIAQLSALTISIVGWTFLGTRIVYLFLYLTRWGSLRSAVWGIGWLASIAPFAMAAFGSR
ncbi:MAG: MAPEG family protein [Myxococcota bacterium]